MDKFRDTYSNHLIPNKFHPTLKVFEYKGEIKIALKEENNNIYIQDFYGKASKLDSIATTDFVKGVKNSKINAVFRKNWNLDDINLHLKTNLNEMPFKDLNTHRICIYKQAEILKIKALELTVRYKDDVSNKEFLEIMKPTQEKISAIRLSFKSIRESLETQIKQMPERSEALKMASYQKIENYFKDNKLKDDLKFTLSELSSRVYSKPLLPKTISSIKFEINGIPKLALSSSKDELSFQDLYRQPEVVETIKINDFKNKIKSGEINMISKKGYSLDDPNLHPNIYKQLNEKDLNIHFSNMKQQLISCRGKINELINKFGEHKGKHRFNIIFNEMFNNYYKQAVINEKVRCSWVNFNSTAIEKEIPKDIKLSIQAFKGFERKEMDSLFSKQNVSQNLTLNQQNSAFKQKNKGLGI